ncbi:MAG: hypothetical protein ISR84_03350 [Kiritimatiellales bacterium]|nr:hypothetical protein [Kiritimatiellales bacterium]
MKKIILLVAVSLLTACSSNRAALSPAPGKCYVETDNNFCVEAHIRSIDGGPDLVAAGESDKMWVDPGKHSLIVVCECEYPWNRLVEDVPVLVEFKKGYRYKLYAHFDGKNPQVEVKEIPHLTHGFFWTR